MSAAIIASSVLCAAGRGSEQVWTTVRSGIARISSSHVMDRHFEPIQMGLVPEDVLEPLPPEFDALPLPSRARRMLRLAAPVLSSVAAAAGAAPIALYLGLPQLNATEAPWLATFTTHLAKLAGVAIDPVATHAFPLGRAASLAALEAALDALAKDPSRTVIVGGVDTFLDLRLLATLEAEQRILGSRVMDGFIPGEGAAFIVLASKPLADVTPVFVQAAVSVSDPGHRYGTEPARGEGLALAIEQLRKKLANPNAPIATTFAGFNGESFDAKLWGVARLRHSNWFTPDMVMQHPADCYGDAGAATGAILLALAAEALKKAQRNGPALVWAASDYESRACAVLSTEG